VLRWCNAAVAITFLVACAALSPRETGTRATLAAAPGDSAASAVYRAVLGQLADGATQEILLGDTTVVDGIGFSTSESLDRFLPGIPLALRQAYVTHRGGQRLPGGFESDLPIRRVSRDSVLRQLGALSRIRPFVEFGEIALAPDSSAALVYAAYYCGLQCADGVLYLLRREPTRRWVIQRSRALWNH
jgi:hypothetical protein